MQFLSSLFAYFRKQPATPVWTPEMADQLEGLRCELETWKSLVAQGSSGTFIELMCECEEEIERLEALEPATPLATLDM